MQLNKFLGASLLIGAACSTMLACATKPPPSPLALPPPVATLVIQAECSLDPIAPLPVAKPALPALPAPTDPAYLPTRTKAAELVALTAIGQRDAERDAREVNARTQAACAAWAKAQGR